MLQKIIQVGNSLAVTIPKKAIGLKSGVTPEFYSWLKKFNAKYKTVLEELSKK